MAAKQCSHPCLRIWVHPDVTPPGTVSRARQRLGCVWWQQSQSHTDSSGCNRAGWGCRVLPSSSDHSQEAKSPSTSGGDSIQTIKSVGFSVTCLTQTPTEAVGEDWFCQSFVFSPLPLQLKSGSSPDTSATSPSQQCTAWRRNLISMVGS